MTTADTSLPPDDFWSDWRSYFDSVAEAADVAVAATDASAAAGARYLSFVLPRYGACALPIESVLTVAPPDGPFHRVPGRGAGARCFLGLASVRGQVQLVFDLTRYDTDSAGGTATAPAEPLPRQLPAGEALVVVTDGVGRSSALRVGAPLRLLHVHKRDAVLPTDLACPLAHLADGCFYEPGSDEVSEPVWVIRLPELLTELEAEVSHA